MNKGENKKCQINQGLDRGVQSDIEDVDTSWETEETVTSGDTTLKFSITKNGVLKRCRITNSKIAAASTLTLSEIIPSKYRPIITQVLPTYDNQGNYRQTLIYASGNIVVMTGSNTGCSGCYVYC